MIRKIALVAVLLVAGVGIAWYIRGGSGGTTIEPVAFEPNTGASADVRIADLERALAAQIDRSRTLERRLAELEGRLTGARAGGEGARRGGPDDPAFAQRAVEMRNRFGEDGVPPDPTALRERMREQQLERLVAQGFTRDRAEWIERRTQELEVQAMQAQYEAQQSGRPVQGVTDVDAALRAELGDADYERYLTANNRPTQVQVMDVLASSNAERSGLQPGDQIVSYAGTRVFDMRELNALTRTGSPGDSVTVEIRRNGQTMQVQVPRGPLGVQGGGLRGGPGGRGPGGAPQGGFRGGGQR
ncbi:MAG TPA: PDZ domain-containing protein [Steroidobacteraceae bacterium]|nr:PDZ domain-containing protein [Steroidobacteraceae bacterium]